MNNRQQKLIQILLGNANHFYSIETLHMMLHCSEKTVRNDLDKIQSLIDRYDNVKLLRKRGKGISLQISKQTQTDMFQDLYHSGTQTNEERIIEIAYQLLTSTQPVTIKKLAAHYYTNNSQIKADIDTIEKWLTRFNLQIQTKQRIGSIVEGSELDKRSGIAHLSELVARDDQRRFVLDFFPAGERKAVTKVLKDIKNQYELEWSDGAFESLVIHALIMIRRTRQDSTIPITSAEMESGVHTKEYAITEKALTRLEKIIGMTFPINERIYYSWHISSSIGNKERLVQNDYSNELTMKVVHKLTDNMQQLTLIQFNQDTLLENGLIVHIDAVLKRMSHGFHITNPMMNDIKKMYPYLFSMVVFALNALYDSEKIKIPEEEAAYLVLHFQASIERMEKHRKPKRVLVICHMGVGMSRLLQAKLEQQYKDLTIIGCIAKNKLQDFMKQNSKIDLIVSTVPIVNETIPHVVISPLLEARDKTTLNRFIQEGSNDLATRSYSTLAHYIEQGFFQSYMQLNHPFKVIEMLANQLVRLNLVQSSFPHRALLRERTSFTSIGGKIAIPHAEPETVKTSAISMAVLQEPIKWGNEYVSIVFLLAIREEEQIKTKDIIKEISALSEQPELVEQICKANKKHDVLALLS